MQKAKTVVEYIEINSKWEKELIFLRELILKTEAKECIKWGAPTYTIKGKNIFGLGAFKNYVGIWFFQGALLSDQKKLLINAQKEKTHAMRQMRFNSLNEINEGDVLFYIEEAIQNQKNGKIVPPRPKDNSPVEIPAELQLVFNSNNLAAAKFQELTKYKQKEYIEHICSAKRELTRSKRIEKIIPLICKGIGLNDKYRNC